MTSRIEVLAPTVIPAQPGFRSVSMFLDNPVTETTRTDEIVIFYEPVIAWMVRPVLEHRSPDNVEVGEPEVTPVLITGEHLSSDFIVDTAGQWSQGSTVFKSELDAREHFLATERRG